VEVARLAIEVFEKQGKVDGVKIVEPGKANP